MNQLNNEAAKNVLDTQPESASENEESDTITDQSSSMSERHKYDHATTSRTAANKRGTGNATMPAATQFSIVHRSDADGLRMRISAIRPPTTATTITATSSNSNLKSTTFKESNSKRKAFATTTGGNKVYNNNENAKTQQKHKHQQHQHQQDEESRRPASSSTTAMSVDGMSSVDTVIQSNTNSNTNAIGGIPLSLIPKAPCLSDATESGLSEATTTTIATIGGSAGNEKAAKKIKVKRKKAQTKANNDAKRALKKSRVQAAASSAANAFSSDSEDDVPLKPHTIHHHQQQQHKTQQQMQQQRAPRLRLTAIINSKNNATTATAATTAPQLKSLTSLAETTHAAGHSGGGSDNIGLSSSDNELPDLVSAAIKRVESDTDDTMMGGAGSVGGGGGFRKTAAKSKHLPQYQSTLLQDFMEKTQMLGETPKAAVGRTPSSAATPPPIASKPLLLATANLDSNSQTDSIASSSRGGVVALAPTKKRRGRPKKIVMAAGTPETATMPSSANVAAAAHINESADSGVISTTSTAHSTSPPPPPVPKMSFTTPVATSPQSRLRRGGGEAAESAAASLEVASTSSAAAAASKPKIDMAYLDKRMYATERVLYPPPRNKRRQSLSAASAAVASQKTTTAAEKKCVSTAAKLTKEELQLDPVWRKIDVNKKFRRPSVSGYKSDGGGGNTTICSKILAAKSGYVSDYGCAVAARHSRSNNNASCSNQAASSSHNHNSGYKSDASGKSRYSTRSCASRRSRAKSCGYRSDYKEINSNRTGGGDDVASTKSSKFRRKRRCSTFATNLRASAAHSKSVGNLNDEQDILQLAGLSLGQSSEESTEYVCKPSLESLPTTSVSKKYGEINRFIATGEYFGRGKSNANGGGATFGSLSAKRAAAAASAYDDTNNGSQDGFRFSGKLLLQRKNSIAASEVTATQEMALPARKIKSRRSSAASYCSSYYSGTSRVRRRRRRKSFRFPGAAGSSMGGKSGSAIDSKLLTEIEIITSTFAALCRIHGSVSSGDKSTAAAKEKLLIEAGNGGGSGKLQSLIASATAAAVNKTARSDKRALKKRKMSENLDFALLSAAAAAAAASSGGGTTVNAGGGGGSSSGSTKRRHKKASASSSPDDHKLPLKKRHYLLTPGEKSTEAAVAVAAKLFASNAEAWAAAAAAAKTSATTKAQLQFAAAGAAAKAAAAAVAAVAASSKGNAPATSTKSVGGGLTPKKRHLLQQAEPPPLLSSETIVPLSAAVATALSSIKSSNSSPLRIVCDANVGANSAASSTSISISGNKLLDISPLSTTSGGGGGSNITPRHTSAATTPNEVTHKKRTRLEGLVTKITTTHGEETSQSLPITTTAAAAKETTAPKTKESSSLKSKEIAALRTKSLSTPRLPTPAPAPTPPPQLDSEASCPPPGVFEPSIELEIQIPPIAKLSEAAAAIITKSEVDSPLLIELNKTYAAVDAATKIEGTRVVETLLNKTGANLLLKRKRKKINRTGFPTVRRKKRKINEQLLLDVTPDISEQVQRATGAVAAAIKAKPTAAGTLPTPVATVDKLCDRVPQAGEASANFLERAANIPTTVSAATIRKPRVSVVALERLQGTPTKTVPQASNAPIRERGRPSKKQKLSAQAANAANASTAAAAAPVQKKPVPTAAEKKQKDLPPSTVKTVAAAAKHTKPVRTEAASEQLATPTQFIRAGVGARATTRKTKNTPKVVAEAKSLRDDSKTKAISETTTATAPQTPKQNKKSLAAAKTEYATPASFTKSTVHKIITAKSLESKVKLPAGIDPNTNFSCKIRLKRRSSIAPPPPTPSTEVGKEPVMTSAEATDIAVEAAAKLRVQTSPSLEDDVLPPSSHGTNGCAAAEYCSSSGDERAAAAAALNNPTATTTRKLPRLKKNYLPAGLFSDYFKFTLPTTPQSGGAVSKNEKHLLPPPPPPPKPTATLSATKNGNGEKKDLSTPDASAIALPPLLLPPPYCEKYFRRSQIDFQLPYDIWWAAKNAKLPSRITVPSWNYRKIRTNIYADAVRPNLNGIDHPTCNCKSDAGCGDNCLNRMVYTECSPSSCPTRERCRNQKIQRHEIAPGAERFMTTDKGWGVRTNVPIPKGTYIMEYVGEVVTEREFKDRMGTIYLNDTHHYCLHLDGGLVIDGHRMGSDGRFVNHSCQPNCEMQKWSVNGLSRMALFAKRPIVEGEELTYDYNFSLFNPAEGQPCRCNTPQCRGVICGKSQRVKPLPPAEIKPTDSSPLKTTAHNGRQRKRKARKNATTTLRLQAKDVIVAARVQQLSEREKKLVKQHDIFLVRNFEKIRRCKAKRNAATAAASSAESKSANTPPSSNGSNNAPTSPLHHNNCAPHNNTAAAAITNRRPSTPNSLAAQISALCSPRNMKTRGLAHAVQDPEVEKMAKMAVILRDICATLETLKDTSNDRSNGDKVTLIALALSNSATTRTTSNAAVTSKKKKALKASLLPLPSSSSQKLEAPLDLHTVQANIEQGYYKQPAEFDADMQKIFAEARGQRQLTSQSDTAAASGDGEALRMRALGALIAAYEAQKQTHYAQLQELLLCEASALTSWRPKQQPEQTLENISKSAPMESKTTDVVPGALGTTTDAKTISSELPTTAAATTALESPTTPTEDIIRCICGLYKDEGIMIQCARCMCWQHAECTKADVTSDTDYHCERCEPRDVDREIPLDDYTDEGHRYYLALMRGAKLHVRQGDAVYVLRDIPITDAEGRRVTPAQKHTYETIGNVDYNECDIFRVERLWRNAATGQRYIFGHQFLRPHETFHEPSRRFYPNEVVRVPIYEVVPIELVTGRCWVLDRTTFCKGRPIECRDAEQHCYICELRVDKSARFFSKAKVNYPTCTKSYAFRKFDEKLKICKSYAPHDVDPSMLKTKKSKGDAEAALSTGANTAVASGSSNSTTPPLTARQDIIKTPQNAMARKRQSSSPATSLSNAVHLISPVPPTVQTIKGKRTRLESVLKTMKLKWKKNTQTAAANGGGGAGATTAPPIDLSYLLSGRGARQRKTAAAASASGT